MLKNPRLARLKNSLKNNTMAKLPEYFFIDRKKFNIKYWNKKEANKVSCDGQFDLDNATITINKDLKPKAKLITVIHEFLHFLVWYNSLKINIKTEEKYVDLFSTQLIEILLNKKNKDLKNLIIKILKDN